MRNAWSRNIREVAALGVDWIGLIFFARSPRRITNNGQLTIDNGGKRYSDCQLSIINCPLKKVGVFVNTSFEELVETAAFFPTRLPATARKWDTGRLPCLAKAWLLADQGISDCNSLRSWTNYRLWRACRLLPLRHQKQQLWRFRQAIRLVHTWSLSGRDTFSVKRRYPAGKCRGNTLFPASPLCRDRSE